LLLQGSKKLSPATSRYRLMSSLVAASADPGLHARLFSPHDPFRQRSFHPGRYPERAEIPAQRLG
jgi:hypothetical protein